MMRLDGSWQAFSTDPGYAGNNWCTSVTIADLRPYGLDKVISSVRRGIY